MGYESFDVVRFGLGPLLQGQTTIAKPKSADNLLIIVSPDESRGYLGFSTVTPPPQRFPFGCDNLKNILVRTFKFGMWVYMGNATNTIVL